MTEVTRLKFSPETEQRLVQEHRTQALEEAHRRRQEIQAFQDRYPPLPTTTPLPEIGWEVLSRQLEDLSVNRRTRAMVHPLIEELQARARWQPPEMLARGLILLVGLVMDETYDPAETREPEPDGEALMP